jgi:hypothetical protein
MEISVAVALTSGDGGVGVLVGFIIAVAIPWCVAWPAMRWSARRRGFRMTLGRQDL